jgi:dienelactone hydrolase
MRLKIVGFLMAACLAPPALHAQELVEIQSVDSSAKVRAYFYACSTPACKEAIVITPTCAGLVNEQGKVHMGYDRLAQRFQSQNHVVVVDHFTSRGSKEDCPKRGGSKMTNENDRVNDVLGAYLFLIKEKGADPASVVYLGFGGGGPLLAVQKRTLGKLGNAPGFAAAIGFYPVCAEVFPRQYEAYAPLLVLHGEADNWNPIKPCRELAQHLSDKPAGGAIEVVGYPGVHHGFFSNAPVQTHPGTGFTIGGDREASMDGIRRTVEFIGTVRAAKAPSTAK